MKTRIILGLVFILIISSQLSSEEGMYPLSEIHKLDLKSIGFEIDAEDIYNPKGISLIDGIINLSGCTASFISADGLILTNHHCAFRAIQSASSKEKDYLKNGFMVENRNQEVEAKGYTVRITESYRDVSREVLAVVNKDMDFGHRTRAIEKKIKEMVVETEKKYPGKRAEVAEMFPNKTYVLFISTYLKDIRLVYAPPLCIGEFGGEIDNWMWPRHTGDFSLLRAYVGPDGKPADYSPDNVSFHPKKFLKIDPRGVDREDLVFLLGYPGRTYRHRSSFFLAYEKEVRMPYVINLYQWMISVMEKIADQDRSVAIKLAPRIKGLSNVLKNYKGKLKGLNRIKLVLKKREQEDKLQAFIDSKPETKKKYGPLLVKIRDFYAQQRHAADYELLMDYLLRGSTLLNTAYTVYEASIEGQKKDIDRKPKYMKRNFSRSKKRLLLRLQNFDQQADAIILKKLLNRALKLETRRISAIDKRAGWSESGKSIVDLSQYKKNIDAFLKNAFEKTRLTESEFIRQLFARSAAELEMLEDPFMELSISLYPEYKKLDEKSKKRKGIFDDLASQLIEIKRAWQGQEFIPDANSTLRLTFGRIRGYSPADAVDFTPLTTLGGVIEKNTGQIPFQVPRKILDLYKAADFGAFQHPVLKDVPVAILYNADTTGGNSGSPVLNARGELVGLNYDRTFEATINDFAWNEQYSRSIGVDIRYILWLIKKFGGAHHLLKEMGVH